MNTEGADCGADSGLVPDPNAANETILECVGKDAAMKACAERVCGKDCDEGKWCTEVAVDETVCVLSLIHI